MCLYFFNRLGCEALGKPEPEVFWRRVRPGGSSSSSGSMDAGGAGGGLGRATLVIDNLIESDSGVFECVATNMVGTASRNFTIRVNTKKKFNFFVREINAFFPLQVEDGRHYPSLPGGPFNTTVSEGSPAALECGVRSSSSSSSSLGDPPNVKWLKRLEPWEEVREGEEEAVVDVGKDER